MSSSRGINILITAGLGLLCAASYLLLLLLFLDPRSLRRPSLYLVDDSFLKPTVAVGLLTALLGGATSAFVTRAVEHSLWLRIAGEDGRKNRLTVKESHRLAQWSVSPWARLLYAFAGASWLLRFGGVLLLASAVLNPILLFGITPEQDLSGTSRVSNPTASSTFAGFLDRSNTQHNGGQWRDIPTIAAGLASMSNLSAPASSMCSGPTCWASARAASLQALCQSKQVDNPDLIGTKSTLSPQNGTLCGAKRPDLCVTLVKSDPGTFCNFTADYPAGCGSNCVGDWADIVGAWVNVLGSLNGSMSINVVECQISYGNVTITQNGTGTPQLDPSTFVKSTHTVSDIGGGALYWHRIWALTDGDSSPYSFSGSYGGASSVNLFTNEFATMLLNYATGVSGDAATVAKRIEANFDMATLFAFAKAPNSTTATITTTSSQGVWKYDWKVLLILLVPLLTKVLVLSVCWKVGSDEVVVGYDPVEISSRGRIRLLGGEDNSVGELQVTPKHW